MIWGCEVVIVEFSQCIVDVNVCVEIIEVECCVECILMQIVGWVKEGCVLFVEQFGLVEFMVQIEVGGQLFEFVVSNGIVKKMFVQWFVEFMLVCVLVVKLGQCDIGDVQIDVIDLQVIVNVVIEFMKSQFDKGIMVLYVDVVLYVSKG